MTNTASDVAPNPVATDGSLRLEHVTKRFGDVTAVNDVDLQIGSGEFFSLLGPSGCGKTTTLRMVAGFETPTAGRILVGDDDLTPIRPAKRPLNMVFQDYALFPHLSVVDNIAFGLKIKRLSRAEQAQRISDALQTMRLDGLSDRRPAQLSGGQRQRVALARALVNRPRALLLDEPLGALDLQLRKRMQTELRRVHQQTGTTFLYVTHDQEEALTMSDRIAVMKDGRVEQLADPRTLYERPSSMFVAEFIGTTNLLVMAETERAGSILTCALGEGQRLTVCAGAPGSASSVQVTVRPERIALQPADPAALDDSYSLVRGVVVEMVYLGSLTQVVIDLSFGERLVVHALSDVAQVRSLAPGDLVVATWSPESAHVIGAVTA